MSIIASIFVHYINIILSTSGFSLAVFLAIFLFWRAGRRELVDSQTLLDVVAVFIAGALIFGRLADFLVRFDYYHLSIRRLVFFNVFWGFDMHGAFIGGVLLVWFYLRSKKDKFWFTFDLGASAVAFGAFLYLFFKYLTFVISKNATRFEYLYYFIGFLIIFWALKRFERKKKHDGFFANFFLVSSAVLNVLVNIIFFKKLTVEVAYYHLIFSFILILLASVNWYVLAKRKISRDIKSAFGGILLSVLKVKRVITNIREADNVAKAIILSPLYLVKLVYFLVKYLGREFMASIFDLGRSFRFKK